MIKKSLLTKFIDSLSGNDIAELNRMSSFVIPLSKTDKNLYYIVVEFLLSSVFNNDYDDDIHDGDLDLFEELKKYGFTKEAALCLNIAFDTLESILPIYDFLVKQCNGQYKTMIELKNALSQYREDEQSRLTSEELSGFYDTVLDGYDSISDYEESNI